VISAKSQRVYKIYVSCSSSITKGNREIELGLGHYVFCTPMKLHKALSHSSFIITLFDLSLFLPTFHHHHELMSANSQKPESWPFLHAMLSSNAFYLSTLSGTFIWRALSQRRSLSSMRPWPMANRYRFFASSLPSSRS